MRDGDGFCKQNKISMMQNLTSQAERYNVACFLAQQSAEKALKAYLFSRGAEEVWGHSVAELCKDAQTFDPSFNQLDTKAGPLDKYYIPTRYPNALPGGIPSKAFDENDAKNAIRIGERGDRFCEDKRRLLRD